MLNALAVQSSVMGAVLRMYPTCGGTISLDGVPLRSLSTATLRSTITPIMQDPFVFGGTLRENLCGPDRHRLSDSRVRETLHEVGLANKLLVRQQVRLLTTRQPVRSVDVCVRVRVLLLLLWWWWWMCVPARMGFFYAEAVRRGQQKRNRS